MTNDQRKPRAPERAIPQSGTRPAQVSRTLREIVSAFATEDLADELIHEALADAGLASLPERAADLREFAAVELRHAVANALSEDAATAVLDGLEPMLSVLERMDASRSVAPEGPKSIAPDAQVRQVSPLRSAPTKIARVALVTDDARLAARVRLALGPSQELGRYQCLEELSERGRVHTSLIIDCRPIRSRDAFKESVSEAREVLSRADVFLMFAGVGERSALRNACPAAGVIVCATREVEDPELTELLATFVGTS